MAKKVVADENIVQIKKGLEDEKVVIGNDRVMKELRNGNLLKIYLSANCAEDMKETLEHYAKLTGTEMIQLPYPNDEFAVLCKKPFSISVVGLKKE